MKNMNMIEKAMLGRSFEPVEGFKRMNNKLLKEEVKKC